MVTLHSACRCLPCSRRMKQHPLSLCPWLQAVPTDEAGDFLWREQPRALFGGGREGEHTPQSQNKEEKAVFNL